MVNNARVLLWYSDFMSNEVVSPKLLDVLPDLTRPFGSQEIKWRVQSAKRDKTSVIVIPYLDSRHVQERLDEVVPGEWSIEFHRESLSGEGFVGGNAVYATLTIMGVSRQDVGSSYIVRDPENPNKKYDENKLDPKTATSDSMKRVASMFGIGRYLWRFDRQVWINSVPDNHPKGENLRTHKFAYKPPTYSDIPQEVHHYLYKLGEESQIHPDKQTMDTYKALLFLLGRIKAGESKVEDILSYIEQNGHTAVLSILKSAEKAK